MGKMFQMARVRVLYAKKIKSDITFAAEVVKTNAVLMFRAVGADWAEATEEDAFNTLHTQCNSGREYGTEVELLIGQRHEEAVHHAPMFECFCPIVCSVIKTHTKCVPDQPNSERGTSSEENSEENSESNLACERSVKRQRPF